LFDGEHIWVTNGGDDTLTQLSASDGTVLGTFTVGDGPSGMIGFDGRDIWVPMTIDSTVWRLNADDGTMRARPLIVPRQPAGIVYDGQSMWISCGRDLVTKISQQP